MRPAIIKISSFFISSSATLVAQKQVRSLIREVFSKISLFFSKIVKIENVKEIKI